MSSRIIQQTFDDYNRTRLRFAQTVLDLSSRPQNVKFLLANQVLAQLRPLLLDAKPNIQQLAALSLSNLASCSEQLAQQLADDGTLLQLIKQVSCQSRQYRSAACSVMRSVARHSSSLASSVVECDGLRALVLCLEEFETVVKEAAAWAVGALAKHCAQLAERAVDAGAVPLLALAAREPEPRVKRAAVAALSDICRHSEELTLVVVERGVVRTLAGLVTTSDLKLRRLALAALGHVARHTVTTAELVVEADVFPDVFAGLQTTDAQLGVNTAVLVKDVVKHSSDLAQLVVNAGGVAAVVDYLGRRTGHHALPAVLALGFIAAHSAQLAMAVVVSRGVAQLAIVVQQESEAHMQGACIWALGQIGRHTPEHAKAVAVANLLPKLLQRYLDPASGDDLREKARRTLQSVLQMCVYLPALDPLLHNSPPDILQHVIAQYSKILPYDQQARRQFVTSGCLRKVQTISADPGTTLRDNIITINSCFPEEIVRFYSPEYTEQLLEKLDQFKPQLDNIKHVTAHPHP